MVKNAIDAHDANILTRKDEAAMPLTKEMNGSIHTHTDPS